MANNLSRIINPGEEVVIKKESMREKYQALEQRIFICESGFGMSNTTSGTKIFGYYKVDSHKGEEERAEFIRGYDISRELTALHQAGEKIHDGR